MHAETSSAGLGIARRMARAAMRRRAPAWLAGFLPWCLLAWFAGAPAWAAWTGLATWAAWVAWDFLRLRRRVARGWARWLDQALPALEDSSALLCADAPSPVAQLQRRRLLARAASLLTCVELRRITRLHVPPGLGALAASVGAAVAAALIAGALDAGTMAPVTAPPAARPGAASGGLVVRVAPPGYTGVAAFASPPRDLQVPVHSDVTWCLEPPPAGQRGGAAVRPQAIELSDGRLLQLERGCAGWSATESLFWRWRGVRYKLLVVPDLAPQITVTAPKDMIEVLAPGATRAAIAVSVRDDYMVRRATLHLTLARGSGENIRFSDRELPLPASTDPRARTWAKQWSLAELGIEPGDELYFFVRASDNARRPHQAQSPTYTLRLPGPPAEDGQESSAQPMLVKPENLRSQRQIIIDTEQLIADLKTGPGRNTAEVRSRSEAIASDQAQLRRRYGQFLGEESSLFGGEDDDGHDDDGHKDTGKDAGQKDKGGQHALVAGFGHMHDQAESATLFDEATKKLLRRALSAMWDAEKALRAIAPKSALAPEHKALDAIKALQQADRIYLHKTAFVPPAIKEELRMSGDAAGANSYLRQQGAAARPVPEQVRALLRALGSDAALPALWRRDANDWIGGRIADDARRLEAQRAVQDVADGCAACRPRLRAWLRGAITEAPVVLQATPAVETPFEKAWRSGMGGKP